MPKIAARRDRISIAVAPVAFIKTRRDIVSTTAFPYKEGRTTRQPVKRILSNCIEFSVFWWDCGSLRNVRGVGSR